MWSVFEVKCLNRIIQIISKFKQTLIKILKKYLKKKLKRK
jgi:hypothetical protein